MSLSSDDLHNRSSSSTYGVLSRSFPAIALVGGIVLFCVNLWRNRFFLHDDAFISLKYATNLANAGEMSWNIGERIEGYTNFLYVLLTAGLLQMGVDPVVAVRIINAVAIVLLVGAVFYGVRALFPARLDMQALSVALVLGNISVVVWLLGGLEAPLAAAFVAWAFAFLLVSLTSQDTGLRWHPLIWSGLAFALAVLTRPDGVIVVAVTFFAILFLVRGPFGTRLVMGMIVAGIPFVVFMVHLGWRVSYYGDVVPNTFHAKVGLDLAQRITKVPDYLLKSSLLYLPVITCAGLAVFVALIWGRLSRIAWVLLTVSLGFFAYVIWSGGDHMAAARVLLPAIGPLSLLAIAAIGSLPVALGRNVGLLCLLLLVVAAFNARSFRMDWAAFNGTIVGQHIQTAWPAGSVVALNTAGSTPFFGRGHVYIDMLGLNDRVIAKRDDVPFLAQRQKTPGHGKGDAAYVLSRQPDYIILGGAEGIDVADAEKWFLTGVELKALPEFAECYQKQTTPLTVPSELAPYRPNAQALVFTYYQRICAKNPET